LTLFDQFAQLPVLCHLELQQYVAVLEAIKKRASDLESPDSNSESNSASSMIKSLELQVNIARLFSVRSSAASLRHRLEASSPISAKLLLEFGLCSKQFVELIDWIAGHDLVAAAQHALNSDLAFHSFHNCFVIKIDTSAKGWITQSWLVLKPGLSDLELSALATFLFQPLLSADSTVVVSTLQKMLDCSMQPESLLKLWTFWVASLPPALAHQSDISACLVSGFAFLSKLEYMTESFWSIGTSTVTHCLCPISVCFAYHFMLRGAKGTNNEASMPLELISASCQQSTNSMALFIVSSLILQQKVQLDADAHLFRDLREMLLFSTQTLLDRGLQPDSTSRLSGQTAFQLADLDSCLNRIPLEHVIGFLQWLLPLSMSGDNLNAAACLMLVSRWKAQVDDLTSLSIGIEFLIAISDASRRAFVAFCIWSEYLCEFLAGIVGLLEKVGKAPKERVCLKALNLKPSGVRAFILLLIKFLKCLAVTCIQSGPVMLPHEHCWTSPFNSGGPPREPSSVVFLKGNINHLSPLHVPLVAAHIQLCQIIDLVMAYEVRSVRPLSLFTLPVRAAFFSRLSADVGTSEIGSVTEDPNSVVATSTEQDGSEGQARLSFIVRIIPLIVRESLASASHKLQLGKVISLAEQLRVNMDQTRAQLSFSLFECGLDEEANESIQLIGDFSLVCSCLFESARARVAVLFKRHDADVAFLSVVSQDVDEWLLSNAADPFQHVEGPEPPKLLDTSRLIKKVHAILPVDSPLHVKCAQLSHILSIISQQFPTTA
jgi:hypothetical protein